MRGLRWNVGASRSDSYSDRLSTRHCRARARLPNAPRGSSSTRAALLCHGRQEYKHITFNALSPASLLLALHQTPEVVLSLVAPSLARRRRRRRARLGGARRRRRRACARAAKAQSAPSSSTPGRAQADPASSSASCGRPRDHGSWCRAARRLGSAGAGVERAWLGADELDGLASDRDERRGEERFAHFLDRRYGQFSFCLGIHS